MCVCGDVHCVITTRTCAHTKHGVLCPAVHHPRHQRHHTPCDDNICMVAPPHAYHIQTAVSCALQSIIQGINGILAPNTAVVQLLASSNSAGSGRRHRRRRLLQASRSRSTRQSKVQAYGCAGIMIVVKDVSSSCYIVSMLLAR